jgi:hypothetical protein
MPRSAQARGWTQGGEISPSPTSELQSMRSCLFSSPCPAKTGCARVCAESEGCRNRAGQCRALVDEAICEESSFARFSERSKPHAFMGVLPVEAGHSVDDAWPRDRTGRERTRFTLSSTARATSRTGDREFPSVGCLPQWDFPSCCAFLISSPATFRVRGDLAAGGSSPMAFNLGRARMAHRFVEEGGTFVLGRTPSR